MDNIITTVILINSVLAILTVFREPRDIAATWAWILLLMFIPVGGFILYSFAGRKLPQRRLFAYQDQDASEMDGLIQQLVGKGPGPSVEKRADALPRSARSLVTLFQRINQTPLATNNNVSVYTSGQRFFDELKETLRNAKETINIEFYTFYADELGCEIRDILVEKAKEGVDVHVLYDSLGSVGTTGRFFKPLREAGGHASSFLHRRFNLINFQLNFRDHRKIVVVDGRIGFVGGFNIGDQYLGRKKKFGHWRDTHLKVSGSAVYYLQSHFLLDWNASAVKEPMNVTRRLYFPDLDERLQGDTDMQIVTSGPDSDDEQIKMGYIRLIQLAKKRCWIQTPYLIPDDSTIDALRIAANSGVDVRIMVPCMPDHMFVYRATQYFASQLVKDGIKVYYYQNGFLHAKTMVVDDQLASVGSANFDFRSFKLNFEVNAFLYDQKVTETLAERYEHDIQQSVLQSEESFQKQSRWMTFRQYASRLLAPIL
ncbi:cardiolipin synthase [Fructobacillus sp. M2-14]|uniref:Cardiolipin synthase n=1 Tax=Fructobacillus broussonetiae TaxID=2713173 RepID=A0ABS5QZD0_9LACO|nr:cardiolipin synthase [Fructobacillus broussonetiae]MBS9338456.1 cardiolipin synthase [Fructobacillus broussonetiae]